MKREIKKSEITTNEFTIDPVGTVFYFEGRVFRCINCDYIDHVNKLLNCGLIKELSEKEIFPKTYIPKDVYIEGCELIIEHEKIPFATRPCEWSFTMLKDIILTMLDVLETAIRYGYTLKDGHPTNLSFLGHKPIFFDLGSFILYNGEIWNAYEEFVENSLIPIQLWRNGDFYIANRMLSDYVKNRFAPNKKVIDHPFVRHSVESIANNSIYSKLKNIFHGKHKNFFLLKNFCYKDINFLKENISALEKPVIKTDWNSYHDRFFNNNSILPYERFEKHSDFIKNYYGIDTLIDLAGNRGLFSLVVSKNGIKNILCTDRDENAVDTLYQQIKNVNYDNNSITPMLHNVVYPISSKFSNYKERICADAVVAFAITHHLILTQNIPIDYIFSTIGEISKKLVGIEFMPLGLWDGLSGNDTPPIPEWYTRDWFRDNFSQHFSLIREEHIETNRVVFWGEKVKTKITTDIVIHKNNWKDIEYFDDSWKNRIAEMASFLEKEQIILDLGCGMQWLKEFLPAGAKYYPIDYISRSDDTIICDFNKHEFPNIHADVAFVSGVLEYIDDYKWFIDSISRFCTVAIVSYCSVEGFPDIQMRRSLSWVNDLKLKDLITLFNEYCMELVDTTVYDRNNIFKFIRKRY